MFRKYTSILKFFTRTYKFCIEPSQLVENPCNWTMLPNGLRVIGETTASPLMCASLFIEAGPRYETACNNGIAHFIEHFAFKGFSSLKRFDFEYQARCLGMKFRAYTTREYQVFYVVCEVPNARYAINFLSRIIIELDVNDYDIEYERPVIEQELIDADRNMKLVTIDYLHQSAFQKTPLAQRVIGPSANIANFERPFVKLYMCEHYQPYRQVLSVSGGIPFESVLCYAQTNFGCLVPAPCCNEFWPCRYTGSTICYRDDSMKFLHCALAVEVPGYGCEEYLQLHVLKHLLGTWDMSMDGGSKAWPRLARASAVSQLCEGYKAFYYAYRDVGLLGVYFKSMPDNIEDMVYNIQDTFMKLCTLTSDADVHRASAICKTERGKSVTGVIGSSLDMGEQMLFTCTRMGLTHNFELLDAMGGMELKTLANKYLYDKCPVVVGVGPCEALPEYTRIRNGMYWLRL